MKKLTTIIILAAAIASCKKSKPITTATEDLPPKIKSYSTASGDIIYNYNPNGTINYYEGATFRYEYSYNGNIVTEKRIGTNSSNNYELGSNGLVSKLIVKSNVNTIFSEQLYTYNADNQVLKTVKTELATGRVTTDNYFYSNKSLDSMVSTFSYNGDRYKNSYEYYTDTKSTITNLNFGRSFILKEVELLLKKYTFSAYIAATNTTNPPQIQNYTYSFDAQKRVTQRVTNDGNTTNTNNYIYY